MSPSSNNFFGNILGRLFGSAPQSKQPDRSSKPAPGNPQPARTSIAELPKFKYHPDPLATGSIVKSDAVCNCCGEARGYIYEGPVYSSETDDPNVCPWCIADGSAHEQLDVSFTDESGIGGNGQWDKVPQEVVAEVAYRTPGFTGWQQERWWTHCEDAAQFLGRAGSQELKKYGSDAIAAVQKSVSMEDGQEWQDFLDELEKDGSPTAYIFRCSKCGKLGGYADFD